MLTTLTVIARGGLDLDPERIRRRCAADADYIRGLITQDGESPAITLGARLSQVVLHAADLGLHVQLRQDTVPGDLPQRVVDAICDATREALNNVARHAETDEAWVSTTWSDGRLTVSVVDRGRGFDTSQAPRGFGLRRSVTERMTEIGGTARVFSLPGEGSSVELFWGAGRSPQSP